MKRYTFIMALIALVLTALLGFELLKTSKKAEMPRIEDTKPAYNSVPSSSNSNTQLEVAVPGTDTEQSVTIIQ